MKTNQDGYVAFSNADFGVTPRSYAARETKESRIAKVIKKLDGLYLYDSDIQKGAVMFGISACSEGYEYRLSPNEYSSSLVIIDTPQKQVNAMVAPLERRLSGIVGMKSLNVKKLLFAQVYWVSANNKATLLLDNMQWFNRGFVTEAFAKLLKLKLNIKANCKREDVGLKLVKFSLTDAPLLVWAYEYAAGNYLMCSTVSGGMIDTADMPVVAIDDVDAAKRGKYNVLLTRLVIKDCETLNFL